jgi:hypothetical protein
MATYGGSIYDEVMGTFTKRREDKLAREEKAMDLQKKAYELETLEYTLPATKAKAKKEVLASEMDIMMTPQRVNLEQQEIRQKFQTATVEMKTEELEDVYRLLSSASNQEQYNTSIQMLMSRYPGFDPAEYGLTPKFDSKTRSNLKQISNMAVENIPHKRALDLQQQRLDHEAAMRELQDREESITKSKLEGAALARLMANQQAEAAGQPKIYDMTQAEVLLAENALRNPDTSAALQISMMSIPAIKSALEGDTQGLSEVLHESANLLRDAQRERQLTPVQSNYLGQARQRWQELQKEGHDPETLATYKSQLQKILAERDIPRELLR